MDSFTEVVTWCFLATNAARVLAYVPQIRAAWKCANGAQAVSRATWSYFAAAHVSGALYGLAVVHDRYMATIFLGNFLACVTLLGVITWKRSRQRRTSLPGQKSTLSGIREQPHASPDRTGQLAADGSIANEGKGAGRSFGQRARGVRRRRALIRNARAATD